MRVAVIGPTNVARVGDAAGIGPDTYTRAAAAVGRLLAAARAGLVVVPDRGVALAAMDAYLAHGGPQLTGLCPSSGVSEPAAAAAVREHRERCHEVMDDLSWYEQHHRIGVLADRWYASGSAADAGRAGLDQVDAGTAGRAGPGTMSGVPPEMLAEIPATVLDLAELADWLGVPQAAHDAAADAGAPAPVRRRPRSRARRAP